MFTHSFRRSFGAIGGAKSGARRRVSRSHRASVEYLEGRSMLTSFAFGGGSLNLDIDTINTEVSMVATGGNSYVFTSTDLFAGFDIPGQLTGTGTNTLTITPALGLVNAFITDSATGAIVDFAGGAPASTWDADFVVALAVPGSGTANVTGGTAFSGAHSVSVAGVKINVSAALSSGTGAITLDADEGAQAAAASLGTVITSLGSVTSSGGAIVIAGRGGNGAGSQVGVSILGSVHAGNGGAAVGTVTITGVGGASGSAGNNYGVEIASAGSVSSVGGAVAITGTGAAVSGGNAGVVIGGTVSTTSVLGAPGNVTVEGFGGGAAGTSLNFGVWLKSSGTLTTAAGSVSVTGHEGVGVPSVLFPFTSSPGIFDDNGDVISTSGDLSFTAASMLAEIFVTGSITTAGTVSIRNLDLGQVMEINVDTIPLLETIVASRLVIGRSDILPVITQAGSPGGVLTLLPGTALELIGSSISPDAHAATSLATLAKQEPEALRDAARDLAQAILEIEKGPGDALESMQHAEAAIARALSLSPKLDAFAATAFDHFVTTATANTATAQRAELATMAAAARIRLRLPPPR
jgi:hypothetical protein